MTTEGLLASVGLRVDVEQPLWFTTRATEYSFSRELEAYTHQHGADGGYLSCTFTVKVSQRSIDEWLENGLARHITVYNPETEEIFSGFANKVSFGLGSLSASRGPLFDITNRVLVVYTPIIDVTVDPPTTGSATETPIAEDVDSQAKYGIIEKVISGGQLLDDGTTDEAEEVRDLYLAEMKSPYTDEVVTLGALTEPMMTIEVLGYHEWLKSYVFNDYNTSTIFVSTKVNNVLDADPNSIFSADRSLINENAQLTGELDDENRMAWAVIEELRAVGDASDNRWVFGAGVDRVCYFRSIPTEVTYKHSLTSSAQNVTLLDDSEIKPWNVRAGVWVEIVDFLKSQSPLSGTPDRKDPRLLFAETVSYTAPNSLSITGSRISTMKQRLKQLGVGGV